MNAYGWIMLACSWGLILGLFGFCLWRMTGKKE